MSFEGSAESVPGSVPGVPVGSVAGLLVTGRAVHSGDNGKKPPRRGGRGKSEITAGALIGLIPNFHLLVYHIAQKRQQKFLYICVFFRARCGRRVLMQGVDARTGLSRGFRVVRGS